MKTGLNILRQREKSIEDKLSLLNKIQPNLPSDYLFLIKHFCLGDQAFIREVILIEGDMVKATCYKYSNTKENFENYIAGLISIDKLLKGVNNIGEDFNDRNLILIGYFDTDDLLLLSLDAKDFGYIYVLPYAGEMFIAAPDIISFLSSLIEEIISPNLEGASVSNLYKNWHEDFWRISGVT